MKAINRNPQNSSRYFATSYPFSVTTIRFYGSEGFSGHIYWSETWSNSTTQALRV